MNKHNQDTPHLQLVDSQPDIEGGKPNYLLRRGLAVVAAGVMTVGAVKIALGIGGGDSGVRTVGGNGEVPTATLDYLRSLPTESTEIPEGGGIDDAAYEVDPDTFDGSANIRAGVEEVIGDELRQELNVPADENFIVPAHAEVDVPVVPPIEQVPTDAQ
jgi:hypothetical protein